MKIGTASGLKNISFRKLIALVLLSVVSASSAHNKVVVIPLFDDTEIADPISPVSKLAPPNSDYFIRSDRVDDEVTGLIWQRDLDPFSLNWQNAWLYCHNLAVDDLVQWRLPEPHELVSIVDYTDRAPAINVNAFPSTNISRDYWTNQFSSDFTSPTPSYTQALTVDFTEGLMLRESLTSVRRVRCVHGRSPSSGGILRNNNNGTISDLATGLTWQQGRSSASWSGALNYCANLNLGGSQNWRVPNIKELVSIADYRTPYDILSVDWFETTIGFIWASHENISHTIEAWVFNSRAGTILSRTKTSSRTVRCVL